MHSVSSNFKLASFLSIVYSFVSAVPCVSIITWYAFQYYVQLYILDRVFTVFTLATLCLPEQAVHGMVSLSTIYYSYRSISHSCLPSECTVACVVA